VPQSEAPQGSVEEAMTPDLKTIDEIRRRVISELVDLEIVSARRLSTGQRILRKLRRSIGLNR